MVVIPAHNEATRLPRCVTAVLAAATAMPGRVLTVVVLDACTDRSADVAEGFGPAVQVLSIDAHNVGAARAAGFNPVVGRGPVPTPLPIQICKRWGRP